MTKEETILSAILNIGELRSKAKWNPIIEKWVLELDRDEFSVLADIETDLKHVNSPFESEYDYENLEFFK